MEIWGHHTSILLHSMAYTIAVRHVAAYDAGKIITRYAYHFPVRVGVCSYVLLISGYC